MSKGRPDPKAGLLSAQRSSPLPPQGDCLNLPPAVVPTFELGPHPNVERGDVRIRLWQECCDRTMLPKTQCTARDNCLNRTRVEKKRTKKPTYMEGGSHSEPLLRTCRRRAICAVLTFVALG